MIIEPDFLDHWKTQMLIRLVNSESAPLLVIRLWAFCQQRKTTGRFAMTDVALAAVCRWDDDPKKLRDALVQAGFIDEVGDGEVEVHDWVETNQKLVANWKNGMRGGRGRKGTHGEPNENPQGTHSEPIREEKRREEKIREEGRESARAKRGADVPESVEAVVAYFAESGSAKEEAEKFFDHFTANGWRQGGKTPLKSWQAAARNWMRRSGDFKKNSNGGTAAAPAQAFNPNTPNAHTGGIDVR